MIFSVIVNTLDRHDVVSQCLRSLLSQQDAEFEIVVVDGSKRDDTERIVSRLDSRIRYQRISERNLSVSRNVGIAMAQGDVVAFIDDDAFAHPEWIARLRNRYVEDSVGAVGGFTRRAKDAGWQVRATLCDRWGDAFPTEAAGLEADFSFPGSPLYPSLLGTNSSFRLSALREIGGFDHAFAYFLDETDVCLRLNDAGYSVVYEQSAVVYHEMYRSALRTPKHYPKSLRTPAKSKSYFMQRHGLPVFGQEAVTLRLSGYLADMRSSNAWFESEGIMPTAERVRLDSEVAEGVAEGVALAAASTRRGGDLESDCVAAYASPAPADAIFTPVGAPLRVAAICRLLPPDSIGGIAQWYQELTTELAASGIEVHVFTQAVRERGVRLPCAGLWVHYVEPGDYEELMSEARLVLDGPDDQIRWSMAAALAALASGVAFDAGFAPVWDAEGLGMQLLAPWPCAITLHTTHALAKPWKPDWSRPSFALAHVHRMEELENLSLTLAATVIANSNYALEAIKATYRADIADAKVIPHGLALDEARVLDSSKWSTWKSGPIRVTFLGRCETRKGFPEALEAAIILARTGRFMFDFIGEAPSDKESLRALAGFQAEQRDAPNVNIRFRGKLTDEEVARSLTAAHVVLMPSRFESFGLVAAEAIAAGCLLVIPRQSAMFEMFGRYPSVVSVESCTTPDLVQALKEMPKSLPNPNESADEARVRLAEDFNLTAVAGEFMQALAGMIGGQPDVA